MNRKSRITVRAVICVAALLISSFNFSLITVQADSAAADAVKKARELVAAAEAAEKEVETAREAAREAATKSGPLQDDEGSSDKPHNVAERADSDADKAAKAADDAQDEAQRQRQEAETAAAAAAAAKGKDAEKNAEATKQQEEANAAAKKANEAEAGAAQKEKESDDANLKAREADRKRLNDQQSNVVTAARVAQKNLRRERRKARRARRAAAQAIHEADKAVAEQAARAGGNQSATETLKGELEKEKNKLAGMATAGNSPVPGNDIPQGNFIPQPIGSGIQVGVFSVPAGRITITLPDDIRAGDTISGTVNVEPNGQTSEEKVNNRRKLADYMIMVPFRPPPVDPNAAAPPNILKVGSISGIVIDAVGPSNTTIGGFYVQEPEPDQGPNTSEGVFVFTKPETPGIPSGVSAVATPTPKSITVVVLPPPDIKLYQLPNQNSPFGAGACGRSGALVAINEGCSPVSQLVFRQPTYEPITTDQTPPNTPTFTVPILGQNGRPIVVTGPFDGNASNTGITCGPVGPSQPPPTSVPGQPIYVIAESPRKAIFTSPTNLTGPVQVTVDENGAKTTLPYRNVGVNLSAPKTSLIKGEKTVLTVQVTGLQNLTQPVPLTLTCNGVITMQGGTYQPLMIQPSQVGQGGIYTTTRDITGVQAGGWGATATVVTGRFNACMQDDSAPARRILWNTFTGDYIFTDPLPPVQPTPQPGGTGLTGTGKIAMKGCIITLTHNAPDRRVFARLDACTKESNAAIETSAPKVNFTITDRNMADNTCPSQ